MQYNLITDYHQNGDVTSTSAILLAYSKNIKEIPGRPSDLLSFCISAGYHPNDMILDDFNMDQLRIASDHGGLLVLYFIGPNEIDEQLQDEMSRDLSHISYEDYLLLEGDFILGSVDMEDVNFYVDKTSLRH